MTRHHNSAHRHNILQVLRSWIYRFVSYKIIGPNDRDHHSINLFLRENPEIRRALLPGVRSWVKYATRRPATDIDRHPSIAQGQQYILKGTASRSLWSKSHEWSEQYRNIPDAIIGNVKVQIS